MWFDREWARILREEGKDSRSEEGSEARRSAIQFVLGRFREFLVPPPPCPYPSFNDLPSHAPRAGVYSTHLSPAVSIH